VLFQTGSTHPSGRRCVRPLAPRSTAILALVVLALGVTGAAAQRARNSDFRRLEPVTVTTTVSTIPQLDIKPGSCSNPVNARSRGRLPVAIVGGSGFDVTEIDLSTIALVGADDEARVYPVRSSVEDVAAPQIGQACVCSETALDGIDDLVLKFDTQDVVSTLGLDLADGTVVELTIVGRTMPVREDGKLIYTFDLSASPGVPPGPAGRGGSCTVTLDEFWGDVSVDCSYRGLVGFAISAHLHDATSIFIPLSVSGGNSGVARGAGTLTPAQVDTVLDGLSYINIHTSFFPGGEISGFLESGSPINVSDCVEVLNHRNRP